MEGSGGQVGSRVLCAWSYLVGMTSLPAGSSVGLPPSWRLEKRPHGGAGRGPFSGVERLLQLSGLQSFKCELGPSKSSSLPSLPPPWRDGGEKERRLQHPVMH